MSLGRHNRVWELDLLRGVALLLMIVFHLCYDLNVFFHVPVVYDRGPIYFLGKTAAIMFIFLAGVSANFSRSNWRRGWRLFLLGLGITAVTRIFFPSQVIKFGILHFLGTALMLVAFLIRLSPLALLALGGVSIWLGLYLAWVRVPWDWLFFLGLRSDAFYSADYYPLFPWLGVLLAGVAVGKVVYREKKSLFPFLEGKFRFLAAAGSRTLLLYLLHQPILLGFLYLLFAAR